MHRSVGFHHEVLTDFARKLIRIKARQLARRGDFSGIDEDEIAQEIAMHLLNQSPQFDPERAPAKAFVSLVIDSAVSNLIRRERFRSKRLRNIQMESLDTTVDLPGEPPAPLESLISVEDGQRRTRYFTPTEVELVDDKEAFYSVFDRLPQELKRICTELMSVPPVVAARNLGISRHKMYDALDLIREHFSRLQ